MPAAPVGTVSRALGKGAAFQENVNTAEQFPGPCTHSEPGLCSGTGSAGCYRKNNLIT